MLTVTSKKRKERYGPYCRALQRGSVGSVIDGRSLPGRFLRRIERELEHQVGGAPTFAQRLLIRRISRMMLRLDTFELAARRGRRRLNWIKKFMARYAITFALACAK